MRILLLALALTAHARSKEPVSLLCMTAMPTTTFELREAGDDYLLKVRQSNGVSYMPIHEGVVTPSDFPYLKNKANMLTKLGDYTEFHFAKKDCHIDGKGLISCGNGETKTFDGIQMQALNFYTSKVHESTMGLELDSWKAVLSIWSPDFVPVMDMTMVYGIDDCKSTGF